MALFLYRTLLSLSRLEACVDNKATEAVYIQEGSIKEQKTGRILPLYPCVSNLPRVLTDDSNHLLLSVQFYRFQYGSIGFAALACVVLVGLLRSDGSVYASLE